MVQSILVNYETAGVACAGREQKEDLKIYYRCSVEGWKGTQNAMHHQLSLWFEPDSTELQGAPSMLWENEMYMLHHHQEDGNLFDLMEDIVVGRQSQRALLKERVKLLHSALEDSTHMEIFRVLWAHFWITISCTAKTTMRLRSPPRYMIPPLKRICQAAAVSDNLKIGHQREKAVRFVSLL